VKALLLKSEFTVDGVVPVELAKDALFSTSDPEISIYKNAKFLGKYKVEDATCFSRLFFHEDMYKICPEGAKTIVASKTDYWRGMSCGATKKLKMPFKKLKLDSAVREFLIGKGKGTDQIFAHKGNKSFYWLVYHPSTAENETQKQATQPAPPIKELSSLASNVLSQIKQKGDAVEWYNFSNTRDRYRMAGKPSWLDVTETFPWLEHLNGDVVAWDGDVVPSLRFRSDIPDSRNSIYGIDLHEYVFPPVMPMMHHFRCVGNLNGGPIPDAKEVTERGQKLGFKVVTTKSHSGDEGLKGDYFWFSLDESENDESSEKRPTLSAVATEFCEDAEWLILISHGNKDKLQCMGYRHWVSLS
jgi:hypothetical protein